MLVSPRKNGLDSLFQEVRVFKVSNKEFRTAAAFSSFLTEGGAGRGAEGLGVRNGKAA